MVARKGVEFEGFTTCPPVSGNEAAEILRRQGGHAPSYIATFQDGIDRTVAVVTCNACSCVLVENELGGASCVQYSRRRNALATKIFRHSKACVAKTSARADSDNGGARGGEEDAEGAVHEAVLAESAEGAESAESAEGAEDAEGAEGGEVRRRLNPNP